MNPDSAMPSAVSNLAKPNRSPMVSTKLPATHAMIIKNSLRVRVCFTQLMIVVSTKTTTKHIK